MKVGVMLNLGLQLTRQFKVCGRNQRINLKWT